MRTLRLLNLHCNGTNNDDINNTVKLNKTFLTVDNGRFHIFGPESMMNGSDWEVNADVKFNKQAKISFFDEDLIRNLSTTKHFRNYIVEEDEVDDRPKKVSFATGDANYVLTYVII
jgi:hypothetical protein